MVINFPADYHFWDAYSKSSPGLISLVVVPPSTKSKKAGFLAFFQRKKCPSLSAENYGISYVLLFPQHLCTLLEGSFVPVLWIRTRSIISSESRVFYDQKLKGKKYSRKYCFFLILITKNCNLLLPRLSKKDVVTGEAFSPQREHPALQKMIFINGFLFLWVIFALLGPGTLLNPDLDPQHWFVPFVCSAEQKAEAKFYSSLVRPGILLND
jgi:hypothetical protein